MSGTLDASPCFTSASPALVLPLVAAASLLPGVTAGAEVGTPTAVPKMHREAKMARRILENVVIFFFAA